MRKNRPGPAPRNHARVELTRLAERIRATNPTGRGLTPSLERSRYAEKARLQSMAIERFPDQIAARADAGTPGVVLLEAPELGLTLCHAVTAELSSAARERLLGEGEASEEPRPRDLSPEGDDAARSGHHARGLEAEVHALLGAYDFAGALETLFAKREGTPTTTWTELFLHVAVDTLGDVATASSARLDSAAALTPDAKLGMARVRLFEGRPRDALELVAPRLDRADVGFVRELVSSTLSVDDAALEARLEERLRVTRGDGCEALEPLEARRNERCRRLKDELDALGSDPECPACRDIALAIGRLAPADAIARRLLAEGQLRHRERHFRAELAIVDDHLAQGRVEAARDLFDDVRSRARRVGRLKPELDDVAGRLAEAEGRAVARAASFIVAEQRREIRLAAVAGARPEVRAACVELAPDLARFVELLEALPPEEAVAVERALDEVDPMGSPEADLVRLGAFRHHALRAPALAARLREVESVVTRKLDETAEVLDREAIVLDEARVDAARRLVGTVRHMGTSLLADRAAALEASLERITSARHVARLPTRSLRLEAAQRLPPRARELLRPVLRDDWVREPRSAHLPPHALMVLAAGRPIVAFCEGPHLVAWTGTAAVAVELDEPSELAELVPSSGQVFAFTRKGEVLALDTRTLEPTVHRRLEGDVSGARVLPNGGVVVFDDTRDELRLHRPSGRATRRLAAQRCRFDDDGSRIAIAAGETIVVTSYGLEVEEEYPAADYALLGVGAHPRDGVTVYALRHRETHELSLSFRHGRTFVTEWLDDVGECESVAFDARGGTLSLLFRGATCSARKYLPFDLGLLEVGRHAFSSGLVAHAGDGRLVAVAIDHDERGRFVSHDAVIGETSRP